MGFEEHVVFAAVLVHDAPDVSGLLLAALVGGVARAEDDEIAFRRGVEQGFEPVIVEVGHAVELLLGLFREGRQQFVGLDALHLHLGQLLGHEGPRRLHQGGVLEHQPVVGARREVGDPLVGNEVLRGAGLGITAAVVPVEGLDPGGVVVPVLLGRGRIAEKFIEVVVGARAVGEHRHLHAGRVDTLLDEPVIARPAGQVGDIEPEYGRGVFGVDLQNAAFHLLAHCVNLLGSGSGVGVRGGENRGVVREQLRVVGLGTLVEEVARFVVREQVQARIEGRHRAECGVEIVVRGVESRVFGALREGEDGGLSVADEKQQRAAGRARIRGESHVDFGISFGSLFCGEGHPVGPLVPAVAPCREDDGPRGRGVYGDFSAAGQVVERKEFGAVVDADLRSLVVGAGPRSRQEGEHQEKAK